MSIKNIIIGLLLLALIGTVISLVYVAKKRSDTQIDLDREREKREKREAEERERELQQPVTSQPMPDDDSEPGDGTSPILDTGFDVDPPLLTIPSDYFLVEPNLNRKLEISGPNEQKETKYGKFIKPCELTYLHLHGKIATSNERCGQDEEIYASMSIMRGNTVVFKREKTINRSNGLDDLAKYNFDVKMNIDAPLKIQENDVLMFGLEIYQSSANCKVILNDAFMTFFIKNVSTKINCSTVPCLNSGVAVNSDESCKCECTTNYVGKQCRFHSFTFDAEPEQYTKADISIGPTSYAGKTNKIIKFGTINEPNTVNYIKFKTFATSNVEQGKCNFNASPDIPVSKVRVGFGIYRGNDPNNPLPGDKWLFWNDQSVNFVQSFNNTEIIIDNTTPINVMTGDKIYAGIIVNNVSDGCVFTIKNSSITI